MIEFGCHYTQNNRQIKMQIKQECNVKMFSTSFPPVESDRIQRVSVCAKLLGRATFYNIIRLLKTVLALTFSFIPFNNYCPNGT